MNQHTKISIATDQENGIEMKENLVGTEVQKRKEVKSNIALRNIQRTRRKTIEKAIDLKEVTVIN